MEKTQKFWWMWQASTAALALFALLQIIQILQINWLEDEFRQAKQWIAENLISDFVSEILADEVPAFQFCLSEAPVWETDFSVPVVSYLLDSIDQTETVFPGGDSASSDPVENGDASHAGETGGGETNTGETGGDANADGAGEDSDGESGARETGSGDVNADGAGEDSNGESGAGETGGETNAGNTEETNDIEHTSANAFVMPKAVGTLYTADKLSYQYLIRNFYTVSSGTLVYESDLDAETLLGLDMTLSAQKEEPQILIYHTHTQEFFVDSDVSDINTGIVGIGNYLTELLTAYGYQVIHLADTFDYVDGKLNRSKAYTYASKRLEEILEEYPSIEVMIDLHRDGVSEDTRLVTEINGKTTAQIMFFNGMSRNTSGEITYLPNENRQANLAFSLQLKVKAEAYYPGFTRKNYLKAYRYNLQLLKKATLIEAGAQTNTFEEVKNAMEPLATLLHIQLSGLQ